MSIFYETKFAKLIIRHLRISTVGNSLVAISGTMQVSCSTCKGAGFDAEPSIKLTYTTSCKGADVFFP